MMAAPSKAMTAALIDFELSSMRFDAIKHRVVREGCSAESSTAFVEAVAQMADALMAINAARQTTQFPPEFYELMNGGVG